jgi:hypothetical protein
MDYAALGLVRDLSGYLHPAGGMGLGNQGTLISLGRYKHNTVDGMDPNEHGMPVVSAATTLWGLGFRFSPVPVPVPVRSHQNRDLEPFTVHQGLPRPLGLRPGEQYREPALRMQKKYPAVRHNRNKTRLVLEHDGTGPAIIPGNRHKSYCPFGLTVYRPYPD